MVVMQDVDCQAPIHAPSLLAFFAARAVPGVEGVDGTTYRLCPASCDALRGDRTATIDLTGCDAP